MKKNTVFNLVILLAALLGNFGCQQKVEKQANQENKADTWIQESNFIPLPLSGSHVMTSGPNPMVTIVFFGEFSDILTHKLAKDLNDIAENYPTPLAISFRHAPFISGERGLLYAVGAEAAGKQGKFWDFHQLALSYSAESMPPPEQLAEKLGLDLGIFQEDLTDKQLAAKVYRDMDLAKTYGLTVTPALLINGRKIRYHGHKEDILKAIDKAKIEAETLIKEGAPPGKIYETLLAKNSPALNSLKMAKNPAAGRQVLIPGLEFPAYGSEDPLIWVYYFTSFGSPFNQNAWLLLQEIRKKSSKVRFIFLPYADGLNPAAETAALCAYWALTQNNFEEIVGLLSNLPPNFKDNDLSRLKNNSGTPLCPAPNQLEKFSDLLAAAGELKKKMGLKANPALLINGIEVPVIKDITYLDKLLAAELKLAEELKNNGFSEQELLIELTRNPSGLN